MNLLSMGKNSCEKSQESLKYEVEKKGVRSGWINLVIVQGSKEKCGSEVALEGEMGAGRRRVAKKLLVGE